MVLDKPKQINSKYKAIHFDNWLVNYNARIKESIFCLVSALLNFEQFETYVYTEFGVFTELLFVTDKKMLKIDHNNYEGGE